MLSPNAQNPAHQPSKAAQQRRRGTNRSRPCDTCRIRKTRCVRQDGQPRCVLCTFHDQSCTFVHAPPSRTRNASMTVQHEQQQQEQEQETDLVQPVYLVASPPSSASSPAHSRKGAGQTTDDVALSASDPYAKTIAQPDPAVLSNTLGLDLTTHAEYIGLTDLRLPAAGTAPPKSSKKRRLDDRTVFLVHADEVSASEAQRIADVDAIEAIARPWGSTLVDLYFRIVHPSFPILHKDVFITKYRASHHHFAPSLLAAVYLIALDWQLYDSCLASEENSLPDAKALEELAMRTIAHDMRRPKLSTLEAGLLLLHRSRRAAQSGLAHTFATNRMLMAQLVAVAQDLGIHLDCSSWSIPRWEIGLRRRLAWALYTQDRWGSYIDGRPFLIHQSDWAVVSCTDSDYPELHPGANGQQHTAISVGWEVFLRQAELAQMLSEISVTFYSAAACRRGGTLEQMSIVEMVASAKPMGLKIREWYAALPQHLLLDNTSTTRELCAVGALHLAYVAVEIALYRALVRSMTPDMPQSLRNVLVQTGKAKVQAGIDFLCALRPEHTASFWGSAAAYQVAEIGALINLLGSRPGVDEEDKTWCTARIEELQWELRVRGSAASFARDGLRLLGRDVLGLLKP
ncbi:Zn(2)-C6 fungal-type domain-containing protein [Trichoderma simmonsii]|uniref:Zn(2)-C6 fungal-type domain-containing protein n=1 Tax=Trichoderma simmonsii TaxID=1491479 RepID=A0A8G0PG60_9HYPO|nr:Zn(2)-C6 fungal-type domain-containing protein [Trichoderma simmonsii]